MKPSKKTPPKRVNTYEVYPKAGVAQTIMYQNMSSHYRRIYNAKPRVDTRPPFSHAPRHTAFAWNKKNIESYKLNLPRKSQSCVSMNTSTKCSRDSCGEQPVPTFKPQITKTDTESKLRTLRVYFPPRRRMAYSSSVALVKIKSDPEISVPEIPWIHTSEEVKAPPSKDSSSDSAYTEEGEGVWSGAESRGPTPVSDSQRALRSEDLLYAKFVRDITEEVLRKGVFTNKALKNIFHSHIDSHKQFLNLRRMQEEVEKLQLELGIPKEDSGVCCGNEFSVSSDEQRYSKFEDRELMEALGQLNLSESLKADIASTLGLHKRYRNAGDPTSASVRRKEVPQSDDDSYEMASEGSESRPLTPLGLAW